MSGTWGLVYSGRAELELIDFCSREQLEPLRSGSHDAQHDSFTASTLPRLGIILLCHFLVFSCKKSVKETLVLLGAMLACCGRPVFIVAYW